MKAVVIGGTGLIGSRLVAKLCEQGHEAIPASPDTGVNTLTGEGLAEALEGAEVVIDVSNSPSFAPEAVMEFFTKATTNLLEAEAEAGVPHHVALSVVGTERMGEGGYFRAKQAQEALIAASSIPYSIVHATQFFEFARTIADSATDGDTVRLSSAQIQPMSADDVASAVGRVASESPTNGIVEAAGPEPFQLDELIRRYLRETGDRRTVVTDLGARYFGVTLEERTLLPDADARLGSHRFEDWMRESAGKQQTPAPSSRAADGPAVDGSRRTSAAKADRVTGTPTPPAR